MKIFYLFLVSILLPLLASGQGGSNMTLHSQYNPAVTTTYAGVRYNDTWGYTAANGDEYALVGTPDSVIIFKVNDCWTAERVSAFAGGNTTIWRDIKTYGNYAYSVCDGTPCNEGLKIIDMATVNNPTPTVVTNSSFFSKAHNIYIDEANARLYAVGTPGSNMIILNISNPTNPTLIANVSFNSITGTSNNFYVHDVYVKNNIAYCSHGNDGSYYVWDVSNITSTTGTGITMLKSIVTGDYNHSSWVTADNKYAYFAEEVPQGLELGIIDLNTELVVQRFSDPLLGSGIPTPHNPYIVGNELYVSYYEDGLAVFDITNPLSPIKTAYYDTYVNSSYSGTEGNWGVYPFFSSGCLVATDIDNGVFFLKVGTFVPVEWLDFTASTLENNIVQLDWSTATEINNDYFEVERSHDGKAFESITTVEGKGTSYDVSNYVYLDEPSQTGTIYYRIKQVDFDGSYDYTDIAQVIMSKDQKEPSIFPNPARDYLKINIDSKTNYQYTILDIDGRVLMSGEIINDLNQVSIESLVSGNYILQLIDKEGIQTRHPFMIVK